MADAKERGHWNAYMKAYQDLIRATATPHAPWYVVPADKKWFSRIVVAAAVHDALEKLHVAYPKVDQAKKKELAAAAALGGAKGEKAPTKRTKRTKRTRANHAARSCRETRGCHQREDVMKEDGVMKEENA